MAEFIPTEAPELEEEIEIPNTGIDGYVRPILYTTTGDPEEIINLDAGYLRVDNDAIIKNDLIVDGVIGIGTTIPKSTLDVNGNMIVSGITTIGIGSTSSPSNSQMSFELTSDTILTIRVKGTDGITRVGTVTLA